MPIIYGRIIQTERLQKVYKFTYADENGRKWSIDKPGWLGEQYETDILEAMYQLSLDGWECFSVTTEGFLCKTAIYHFKKGSV